MITIKPQMPKDNTKITKIIVSSDDEITDIVCGIIDSPNERVLVTFSEESDLLISPINLRVILETADERGKLVILQIVNNSTGVRNAHLAGLAVIENIALPTENDWVNEKTNRDRRLTPKKEVTKDSVAVIEAEEKDSYDDIVEDAMEKNGEGEEETPLQKKINEVIEKSKSRKKEVVDDLTLDDDIPITYGDEEDLGISEDNSSVVDGEEVGVVEKEDEESNKKEDTESLVGKDFSVKEGSLEVKENGSVGEKSKFPFVPKIKNFNNKNKEVDTTDENKKKFNTGKFLVILGSILFVAVLVGLIYYYTKPLVKVRVYVSAKQVSVEKTFTGEENILEIDKENLKVPTKNESLETSRSGNVTATGVAYKGENATGSVQVFFVKDDCTNAASVTLPAGQVISAYTHDGISYTLNEDVVIQCNKDYPVVGITATDIGDEYNIPSGEKFSVAGQDNSIFATAQNAITGGSKKEYTVLTQADVDKAVDELRKGVEEEAINKLKSKSGEWQIIEASIKNELAKENIKLNSPVGSEVSYTDVDITVKSSATYYLQSGLLSMVDTMLTNAAKEQNLFEGDGTSLSLGSDVEKSVEATLGENDAVSVKLIASASIKPNVNKDEIVSKVKSMKWKEGCDYLKSLKFSDKETEIDFSPANFPDWLKYFPTKQGGVMVEVKEVY
ncbi:hypothetical protein J6Z48_03230 [bacterium]|nr:hypothetical protein [bacterium]